MRKAESLTRLNIEQFRSDMSEGLPAACRLAREAKLKELQAKDPNARLKPLKNPGARTINKCLGVLVSALRYGKKIRMLSENVAEGIEKLPVVEGEERCIEKNVLTPAELLGAIQHAVDPFRIPIAMGAYTGLRQEMMPGERARRCVPAGEGPPDARERHLAAGFLRRLSARASGVSAFMTSAIHFASNLQSEQHEIRQRWGGSTPNHPARAGH